jgi:hypothetical protein
VSTGLSRATPSDAESAFSEPAWTMAAPFATPPPPVIVSPINYANATVSLLEIQRRERDAQMQAENKPPPMTILQIQEQERRVEEARVEQERKVEEARQVELEFERWWKEEQARLHVGGQPAVPNGGSKRGKKKPAPDAASTNKERKEGGGGRKPSTSHDQTRRKGEQKKQTNTPASTVIGGNQQQHNKGKEAGGHGKPRKNNNSDTNTNIPPARGFPPAKQQQQRNGNGNHDRAQSSDERQAEPRQHRPAAGKPNVILSAEKAPFINVAAPAFVPQQTPAPPAFNPQAAVFLPPSMAGQR